MRRSHSSDPIKLDARGSPADLIRPGLLDPRPDRDGPHSRGTSHPQPFDQALRWLAASDRVVSDLVAGALLEVKQSKAHLQEGHARWNTYLRAFVPLTSRWCQQEMKRSRDLRGLPALKDAYDSGAICKSRVRVILRIVTPETEELWIQRGRTCSVLTLEELVRQERAGGGAMDAAAAHSRQVPEAACDERDEARSTRRVVMAPPGVAAMVAEAVEVARKVEGYHISAGKAVSRMAIETMAGLSHWPDAGPDPQPGASPDAGSPDGARPPASPTSLLGDEVELRRELGRGWELLHRHFESITAAWSDLPWDPHEVLLRGAPADSAAPHDRLVFWSALQGRLDAVRGRLLRITQERGFASRLHFAGFGHYVRERCGLSLREANALVALDRALDPLPIAFRAYASGRLTRAAAWLVSRAADSSTDRAWTRFALTHSRRLLEAVVEASLLKRQVDPEGWIGDGRLPPENVTFADALRACSLPEGAEPLQPTARISFVLDPGQRSLFDQACSMLRALYGPDNPDWWCLAVMARHFLDCYAEEDKLAVPERLRRMMHRRVIERDNYTCGAPECLQRGGLESDHMRARSLGGSLGVENQKSLCSLEHQVSKHRARTLAFSGKAPDDVTIKMGRRIYHNDTIIFPVFDERVLDEDPWRQARGEPPRAASERAGAGARPEWLEIGMPAGGRVRPRGEPAHQECP